jgi:DNA topoisomerase I
MLDFAKALPGIGEQVERDLRRHGLPREKTVATVVRLLETTFIRVGNEEYAKENSSFGLTTLRDRHVKIEDGGAMRFHFRGKSAQIHDMKVDDAALRGLSGNAAIYRDTNYPNIWTITENCMLLTLRM